MIYWKNKLLNSLTKEEIETAKSELSYLKLSSKSKGLTLYNGRSIDTWFKLLTILEREGKVPRIPVLLEKQPVAKTMAIQIIKEIFTDPAKPKFTFLNKFFEETK